MVEEMAPLRSIGYVDPGWEHGTAQDERLSGEVTHCEKVPEEVSFNMRKNLEGCHSVMENMLLKVINKGKKVMGEKNLVIKFTPLRSLGYVDPGWEHCVAQDEKKRRVKCNYCEKIISGGINRFKQHLARIPGEVSYCEKAPEEVYLKIKENMKWHRTGRRHRKPDTKEISTFYLHSDNEDEGGEEEGYLQSISKDMLAIDDKVSDNDVRNNFRGRSPGSRGNGAEPLHKKSRLDLVFLKSLKSQTSAHYKQPRARKGFEKKAHREVISAICKFFYHAGIPSNAANSPYFRRMLELVGQYGQGLQGPSIRLIFGRLLQEIANIKEYLVELKTSWAITGCSVMADSWNDAQGRTLIKFLVSCPRGVYFLFSVDATDMIEDAVHLFKLLDKAVDEVGEEYVVHMITGNTLSFRNAGKMLEEKMRNLFWTPCAVYCIDRMFEDFVNIKWYVKKSLEPVAEVLQKIGSDKIRSMPFIYNDICRTKLANRAIHGDDVRKYGPFWSVIDSNWSSLFHHPLYVAAYYLNPSYRQWEKISASMQIPDFVSAKADFGTDLAISTRNELDPASWWQQHGIRCLELQRIAIRILSQHVHQLGVSITGVHLIRKPDELVSFDSSMLESVLDDWLVETEKLAMPEDEEIIYNEVEQFCGDDMDEHESEEKKPTEMVTIAGFIEPLDIIASAGGVTTDDDGLDFLDDDLTY
ncbi:HAT dimerization domain-containing protein isoform 2 [Hibiscus syriacus]|uniref:HAT dimerization domain-containing protein isoform 2 n=1 Tax=Hibiscus syriacus TaxID=106335 RepID=A0A6A3AHI6_HIBSY|nr:HAT dimerization domain-containing protein isoform 2 [Hibiscus syriacus]